MNGGFKNEKTKVKNLKNKGDLKMKSKTIKKRKKDVKKFNLIKNLLIAEYSLILVILITSYYLHGIYITIKTYQNSISQLQEVTYTLSKTYEDLFKPEITSEQVNYMAKEEKTVENNFQDNDDRIYLGNFKITHYCACKKCCGANAQGITASGKRVEEGKTIAVDTKVIKMGSHVYIDGYGEYEAQDTGSAIKGNIIDVYVADHNQALQMGVQYKDVYLLK